MEVAAAFYGALFGWESPPLPPEAGGYRLALLDGKVIGGIGPLQSEGQPPAWTTYVSVADADATAVAVGRAGGTVLTVAGVVLILIG